MIARNDAKTIKNHAKNRPETKTKQPKIGLKQSQSSQKLAIVLENQCHYARNRAKTVEKGS